MLEEHLAEHAVFWQSLSGSAQEVITRFTELAGELEAHMATEQRTFLSWLVRRDDVIARHHRAALHEQS